MEKKYWTVEEVVHFFQLDEDLLIELEEEEIICPVCGENGPAKLFSVAELEKVRLVKILTQDMGVNLPGVEVILNMREKMFEMRRQFDAILELLAQDLKKALEKGS